MKHLVIGMGEVGTALYKILSEKFSVAICDKRLFPKGTFDVLHICFPYSEGFEEQVGKYVRLFKSTSDIFMVIVHSTVPVGTCRRLGAVHSPIHGIHPNLVSGIKTFVKYIGAVDEEEAHKVLGIYNQVGIKGLIVDNPETSEISKLGCTTRHGLMIMEQKLFKRQCEASGANFSQAYTDWNGFYGMGYRELGLPYLQRAIVKDMPGRVGGHCIISNLDLLGGPVAQFVKEQNETL